jgi:predicted nucleic acid-binding protein
MNFFFWDTSALAKRYIPELGTSSVNYLIETVPKNRMFMLILSLGEILSVLVRKRNSKQISDRFKVWNPERDSQSDLESFNL